MTTLRDDVARAVQSTRLRTQRGGPTKLTSTDKQIADAAIAVVLERAAQVGYLTCAETRHVALGDNVSQAIRNLKEPT